MYIMSGDYSNEVTPVPIPNTEVKLICADGTAGYLWESRSSPDFFIYKVTCSSEGAEGMISPRQSRNPTLHRFR